MPLGHAKRRQAKAKANEYLKRCRADMKMVGERVDVEVKMPEVMTTEKLLEL